MTCHQLGVASNLFSTPNPYSGVCLEGSCPVERILDLLALCSFCKITVKHMYAANSTDLLEEMSHYSTEAVKARVGNVYAALAAHSKVCMVSRSWFM